MQYRLRICRSTKQEKPGTQIKPGINFRFQACSKATFMRKISLLILVSMALPLLFLSSCSKKSDPEEKEFRFNGTIQVDGRERTYLLNLPPGYYEGSGFSLVIAMHGGGGEAIQFESSSKLTDKANTSGFIVVYPEGVKSTGLLQVRTWNAGQCCDYAVEKNIDDVTFISALIDELKTKYKIDPRKVYATGHSNGGMMSYRLACELSGKIAAIAPNGCTMVVTKPCLASRPVPVLHMHSELDKNIPYQGGYGDGPGTTNLVLPSLDSVFNVWSALNTCGKKGELMTSNSGYTFKKWSACTSNANIEYYLTKDGGHSWPGGLPGSAMGDPASTAISANDLLWEFFQRYQLP